MVEEILEEAKKPKTSEPEIPAEDVEAQAQEDRQIFEKEEAERIEREQAAELEEEELMGN